MKEVIDNITRGLTLKERGQVLRWISSLPEDEVIEVFQMSIIKYHALKTSYGHLPRKALQYACLIMAGREKGWDTIKGKGYRVAGREQFDDWAYVREARILNLARDRPSPKKRQALAVWGEIVELKNGNIGFKRISRYLKKYKKINISSSYLHMMWTELEKGAK